MSKSAKFKIQNHTFKAAMDLADTFKIQSVPRPYTVNWDNRENPGTIATNLMAQNPNNLLLIDKNVYKLYKDQIKAPKVKTFIAEATEEFKSLDGVVKVVDFLQKNQITKAETLVVVGGGIIQDVGAFVGAAYKRGIPWAHVPTTLLAMCDSCIGGKTGINYQQAKNQLALFSAPHKIIINPNFLKTLGKYYIDCGLGEILKLNITGGKDFVAHYNKHLKNGDVSKFSDYKALILGALSVKKAVVEKDEFELDLRRCMNYGHTVGHAVEALSEYKIPHGHAVVIGMIIANELSKRHKLLSAKENNTLNQLCFDLIDQKALQIMRSLPAEGIKSLLKKDKKTLGNSVTFALIKSIGEMVFLGLELNNALKEEIADIIKEQFHS